MLVAMATEINKLVIGDSDRDHDVKGVTWLKLPS